MSRVSKIRESLSFIEKNLNNDIRLEELSNIVYLSKYHYHRLFRELTGDSVKQYISKRRMAEAARELVSTDGRILDIALRYQYGSQEAFTRAFKRLYGTTPGEYRKQYSITGQRRSGGGTTSLAA